MRTPTMALAWEFWRRHRNRWFLMAAVFLFFVVAYPALCARAGLDLGATDFTDSVGRQFVQVKGGAMPTLAAMGNALYLIFLAGGPGVAMVATMASLIWMFTFTAPDPNTKDPLAFPLRLFTLPVSTPFLFWRFFLGGQLAMAACSTAWTHLVRQPQLEAFNHYEGGLGWMAFMAVMQGLVWALAAWPNLRMLSLVVALFGFVFAPQGDFPGSSFVRSPECLVILITLAAALGRVGLEKMRHGQWQGWNWDLILARFWARGAMPGPRKFSSPQQAQLWFEWRRKSRRLCLYTALIGLTPVVALVLARVIFFHRPVDPDTLCGLVACLLALPLFLHFSFLTSEYITDLPFMLNRPLTNGQLMTSAMKSSGIATVVSFAIAAVGIGGVACLGDIRGLNATWKLQPQYWLAIIPAALFLTWRLTPANLCFLLSGQRRLKQTPVLALLGSYLCVVLAAIFNANEDYRRILFRVIPILLVGLVILKFTLAAFSFRTSIKRGLLSRSAAGFYLVAWFLIAAAVMLPVILIVHDTTWIFYLCLLIVLLTPLFRVGLCPIMLAWNRHA